MKNLFISNMHEKDVEGFTTDLGLSIRKKADKPFKKMCNIFTNANIICEQSQIELSDKEYFEQLTTNYIPATKYPIVKGKNNIIVERYPKLNKEEPYIFVCNHTCPEDIETVLNILDRNAYLVLGSIESLQYNPEMYLSWLNGMIPFDIMDKTQRKEVLLKMKRVLKTNSILIFPEGSHNFSPNKLVNNLFDGPVNLALQTNRKIVVVTMIKDMNNNTSYVDVSNPIDISKIEVDMNINFDTAESIEKYYIKSLTSEIRDKMATAVYYLVARHISPIVRSKSDSIEENIRKEKIEYAFEKLKWDKDIFEAEYLTKKTKEEKEYEEINKILGNIALNSKFERGYLGEEWLKSMIEIENKDVIKCMRKHLYENKSKVKTLKK